VGSFAPQIARVFGAEVTAVVSPRNLEAAASMGADHIIDYTREDFTRSRQKYDLIFAINGYHNIITYRRALSPTGRFVMAGASSRRVLYAIIQVSLLGRLLSKENGQKFGFMGLTTITQPDLVYLGSLLEAGKIVPMIEKRYTLYEAPQALAYLATGHARGKNVIIMDQEHPA
jgi:NADPH:quinone reductase-like Zn-dependent oxidoreductase